MKLLEEIEQYYSGKIASHGATPQGVDWNSKDSQYIRFTQIAKIIDDPQGTVVDLGCGYGEFYSFLREQGFKGQYIGVDISPAMVEKANELHSNENGFRALLNPAEFPKGDFVVASGIFSVKLSNQNQDWEDHVKTTIKQMYQSAQRGASFNCLTSYSDTEKMKEHLSYMSPEDLFGFCKKELSLNVALLHNYGLYEFTLLVSRNPL